MLILATILDNRIKIKKQMSNPLTLLWTGYTYQLDKETSLVIQKHKLF